MLPKMMPSPQDHFKNAESDATDREEIRQLNRLIMENSTKFIPKRTHPTDVYYGSERSAFSNRCDRFLLFIALMIFFIYPIQDDFY